MTELLRKQLAFSQQVAALIQQAEKLGFAVALGEAYRPPETAALYAQQGKGSKNSLHIEKLAVDLNLFYGGVYLKTTEDHRPLGEWWEARGVELGLPLRWGGRWGDGNHYSCEYKGRK